MAGRPSSLRFGCHRSPLSARRSPLVAGDRWCRPPSPRPRPGARVTHTPVGSGPRSRTRIARFRAACPAIWTSPDRFIQPPLHRRIRWGCRESNPAGPKATGLQPVPVPYRSRAPKLKEPPEVSLGWLLPRSACSGRYSKGALPSGCSSRAWVGRRWLGAKPALRPKSARQNTAYEPADQSRPRWPAGLLVHVMFAVCRIVIPVVEAAVPLLIPRKGISPDRSLSRLND